MKHPARELYTLLMDIEKRLTSLEQTRDAIAQGARDAMVDLQRQVRTYKEFSADLRPGIADAEEGRAQTK